MDREGVEDQKEGGFKMKDVTNFNRQSESIQDQLHVLK